MFLLYCLSFAQWEITSAWKPSNSFDRCSKNSSDIHVLSRITCFLSYGLKIVFRLRPCAHESGSVRLQPQTGTDWPTVHSGSNLSAPAWLRYPYKRGTDKKNGAAWLRSIWLLCEPTDLIQKKVQIGNEANFVYKRGLSTFLYFSSWLPGMLTSNMYLSLIGSTWIRSRVHANYFGSGPVCMPKKILDQIQKRTEPYGSALVCTGPKAFCVGN